MRKPRKTSTVTVRLPDKTKFAIDLLCERHGASISTVISRAIEDLAERENLTTRKPGEMLSLLDKLWDEDEHQRLRNMYRHAPELMPWEVREAIKRELDAEAFGEAAALFHAQHEPPADYVPPPYPFPEE